MSFLIQKRQFISKRSLWFIILFTCILSTLTFAIFNNISPRYFDVSRHYTSKYPYIALIVDDRATQLLVNAVINVLQHIPNDWKVQIITPQQHWSFYVESSLGKLIKTNRVLLTPFEKSSNVSTDNNVLNLMLTSASFWHQVQGDKVLFFQIDTALCSNSLYNLTDFLQYDFIGAPWQTGGCCNGGLSLRSRSKILQMLENGSVYDPVHLINEDGWFAGNLPNFNGSVAPTSIAQTFSVETIYHPRPFAVHNPRISAIGSEDMSRLCNECPEVRTITSDCPPVMNGSTSKN